MPDMQTIINDAYDMFDEPSTAIGKYNQDSNALALKLANRIYLDICKKGYSTRTSSDITTVSGTREYVLPEGFATMKKVLYDGKPLDPIREHKATRENYSPDGYYLTELGDGVNGTVTFYIGIDPLPDSVYTVTAYYTQRPTANLTLTQIPFLLPSDYHYIISEGIVKEFMKYDKGDKSQGFMKWDQIYRMSLLELKDYYKNGVNKDKFYNVS
jgi:hypothetical protein